MKHESGKGRRLTQTSQSINPINIHRTAPTNTLSAAPSERKRRIYLILDPDERIQHHGAGLVQVQRVRLHPRLRGRLVGVPAVDVEGLGLGFRIVGGLFDRAGLRGRYDGCHSADAHWGAQGGTEGHEGAAGEACCHRGGECDGLISISLRR